VKIKKKFFYFQFVLGNICILIQYAYVNISNIMIDSLSGGDCEVDANGIISDQGNCRFIPNATDQTATTSLMSFHWLESVPT
jgi:hypothetical protein